MISISFVFIASFTLMLGIDSIIFGLFSFSHGGYFLVGRECCISVNGGKI